MHHDYLLYQGSQEIGRVRLEPEGLYYRISCSCRLTGEIMCKVQLILGDTIRNLGVLVPDGGCFTTNTRVPQKLFTGLEPRFEVIPHLRADHSTFIPVYPEEPFVYLSRLKHAHLERREGCTGIVLE